MIDAYIQAHKISNRLEECLAAFRMFYPDSSILLVSDNGDDLSGIATKFRCEYIYSTTRTGMEPQGFTKEQNLEWFGRLTKAAKLGNNPYLIYLEDDVLVRGHVNIDRNTHISGVEINPIDHRIIRHMEQKHNVTFNTNLYGASGGAIYKKETMLEIHDDIIEMMENDLPEMERICGHGLGYLDLYMAVFYMAKGIKYQTNDQLVETHRNSYWRNTNHPIVHGKDWLGYFNPQK